MKQEIFDMDFDLGESQGFLTNAPIADANFMFSPRVSNQQFDTSLSDYAKPHKQPAVSAFVIKQQPIYAALKQIHDSFNDDLLNLSLASASSTPILFSQDLFDKFLIKFNIIAHDIENIHAKYPQIVPDGLYAKLQILKKDTSNLAKEVKKIDSRASEHIHDLEKQSEFLTQEIVKLRGEIENLLQLNSELSIQLSTKSGGDGRQSKLDISYNKVNVSQLYASEEKVDKYMSEIKNLKGAVDTIQKEKQKMYEE